MGDPLRNADAQRVIEAAIGTLCTACVLLVERRGSVDVGARGSLCPDADGGPDRECEPSSLFDLASLTKLATTALLLSYVRSRT